LALPLLAAGQAQKEMFHNEALQRLDALVAAAVEEPPRAAPPDVPTSGNCYIVAASPTGAWVGHAHALAAYSTAGWRFIAPVEGLTVHVRSTGVNATYRNGGWAIGILNALSIRIGGQQVVGARSAAISAPTGGSSADAQCRDVVEQILAALRHHGLIET
jgi:hypothetical protein